MSAELNSLFSRIPYQYSNAQRLRTDVSDLLRQFTHLRPQIGTFDGQGRSVTLFYLHGTVPITYRGNSYNIPMTVYFDPPYPDQPPRCFVSPTAGMSVKPGHNNVDQNGMVYLPYLHTWDSRRSTLVELLTICASAFSENPPVYSGPAAQARSEKDAACQSAVV